MDTLPRPVNASYPSGHTAASPAVYGLFAGKVRDELDGGDRRKLTSSTVAVEPAALHVCVAGGA